MVALLFLSCRSCVIFVANLYSWEVAIGLHFTRTIRKVLKKLRHVYTNIFCCVSAIHNSFVMFKKSCAHWFMWFKEHIFINLKIFFRVWTGSWNHWKPLKLKSAFSRPLNVLEIFFVRESHWIFWQMRYNIDHVACFLWFISSHLVNSSSVAHVLLCVTCQELETTQLTEPEPCIGTHWWLPSRVYPAFFTPRPVIRLISPPVSQPSSSSFRST